MQHTEHHKEVTIRIDDFTTITLSDEMGGLSDFIDERLRKVKNIFEAHELLIDFLQHNLEFHKWKKSTICHVNKTPEEYTKGLRDFAKQYGVYVEGEV